MKGKKKVEFCEKKYNLAFRFIFLWKKMEVKLHKWREKNGILGVIEILMFLYIFIGVLTIKVACHVKRFYFI